MRISARELRKVINSVLNEISKSDSGWDRQGQFNTFSELTEIVPSKSICLSQLPEGWEELYIKDGMNYLENIKGIKVLETSGFGYDLCFEFNSNDDCEEFIGAVEDMDPRFRGKRYN